MRVDGAVAQVTGANRGLGAAFTRALLARGAARVFAGMRHPEGLDETGAVPMKLDITAADEVAAAARACSDVTLMINNAAEARRVSLLADPTLEYARAQMETNYFGTLSMCEAFAPILGRNGGGALVRHQRAADRAPHAGDPRRWRPCRFH